MDAAPEPVFILHAPQLGQNIGAAARAMWNFGLMRMRLVAPRDGWPNPDAVAMASGATRVLDRAGLFADLPAAIADLGTVYATTARPRELTKRVLSPDAAIAEARARLAAGERVGLLFGARRAVRVWLMVLFALVVLMIAVGGLTRLTDSGLSITEWAPITGAIPPLSSRRLAGRIRPYRQIPEYQLQNRGMSLAEFKVIYWWEWGHRQLGRVIGLVWAVGFFGFCWRARFRRLDAAPVGLGVLGGLQGRSAGGWCRRA
jgi:hypothetical protein